MKRGFGFREGERIEMQLDRLVTWEETWHGCANGGEEAGEKARVQSDFLVWQKWILGAFLVEP